MDFLFPQNAKPAWAFWGNKKSRPRRGRDFDVPVYLIRIT
jgi:hypothetical protein